MPRLDLSARSYASCEKVMVRVVSIVLTDSRLLNMKMLATLSASFTL